VLLPQRGDGRAHRRSCRQTVVDEYDDLIFDCRKCAVVAVQALASLELEPLACRDARERVGIDVISAKDRLVHDPNIAARDRSDAEFLVAGQSQLANDEDVERRVESHGNLERDRNASSRQTENQHVVPARIGLQPGRQLAAGFGAVLKSFSHLASRARRSGISSTPHARI